VEDQTRPQQLNMACRRTHGLIGRAQLTEERKKKQEKGGTMGWGPLTWAGSRQTEKPTIHEGAGSAGNEWGRYDIPTGF